MEVAMRRRLVSAAAATLRRCYSLSAPADAQRAVGFAALDGRVDATSREYSACYKRNGGLRASLQSARDAAASGGSQRAKERYTRGHGKLLLADRLRAVVDDFDDVLHVGRVAGCEDNLPGSGAGVFTGVVTINGRQVMLCAQDGTVKGGATYPIGLKKQLRAQRLANTLRISSAVIVDSAGAFLPLQCEIFPDRDHGGRIFRNEAVLGARGLTQFAVVAGSCTAGGAYAPTMCDHAVIVDRIGTVFLGGPPLVRAATGEVVTAEQLGGATTHCVYSGAMDYKASTEHDAYSLLRDLVLTAPDTGPRCLQARCDNMQLEPLYPQCDLEGLAGQSGGAQDGRFIRQVLSRILDKSEMCEFRQLYGTGLITGWAHIAGVQVGVLAATGSSIERRSCEKASQFVQMCSAGAAPTPLLVIQRSLHHGWSGYDAGDLKGHAQLMSSLAQSNSLKVALNVGDAIGAHYFIMCGRGSEPAFYFAWPNARIAYDSADLEQQRSLTSASELHVDDVILPQETRRVLIRCLQAMPRHARADSSSAGALDCDMPTSRSMLRM